MKGLPSRASFRDRRHFLIAIGSELAAPALRIAARSLSRGAPTLPREWRRALIVGHAHIGDVLCQTVSLDSLARELPDCRFDYLTSPIAAEVLMGNPALESVLPWVTAFSLQSVEPKHLVALRAAKYDAILCTNVVRHQEALRLALALRIPNRVAFVHRGLSGLVTLAVQLPHPMTPAAQSRAMAAVITGVRDTSELRPRVFLSESDVTQAAAEWIRLGLGTDELVVACSVTTRQEIGRLPTAFFASVLQSLHRIAPQARIVLTGSRDDASILKSMARTLGNHVVVSAGTLTLRGFAAFLARCSIHFCMDSGPRHLANAVGIPVVFARNLAVRAAEAGAYCRTELDVMPDGDYLTRDRIRQILSEIDPDAVAAAILRRSRQTHAEREAERIIPE